MADEDSEPLAELARRHNADMRAIRKYQRITGNNLLWPDHADLCVWLLEQDDKQEAVIARQNKLIQVLARAFRALHEFNEGTHGEAFRMLAEWEREGPEGSGQQGGVQ